MNLAQTLGYLGPVTADELTKQKNDYASGARTVPPLQNSELVGRTGLEDQYDSVLRGTSGVKKIAVDIAANVVGTVSDKAPVAGNYLVTNIDAGLQAVVEQQLQAAIDRAKSQKDSDNKPYKADAGAAIVMDVTNGHVLAMASYPTYDPSVWVGGISNDTFTQIKADGSLTSTAFQGLYAPASTFKIATTAAALSNGYSTTQQYACPSTLPVGNRVYRNNEGNAYGNITFKRAIELSCDTIYYGVGKKLWERDGGRTVDSTKDTIESFAEQFGIGRATGIDLPNEAAGRLGGRAARVALVKENRDNWCTNSTNTKYSKTQRDIWAYNCQTGYPFEIGDEVNFAIGQGETAITPLQMVQAYAALANGGTVYQPQVARAVVTPDGKTVSTIAPKKTGTLDVSTKVQNYLRAAFAATTKSGTAAGAFPQQGWVDAIGGIGTKTGTGQVANKQSTSWFASYAPAKEPKYAVLMMVSQGGTGVGTSGASVANIYKSIFGVKGNTADPKRSVLVGGAPTTTLPKVAAGSPVYPGMDAVAKTGSGGTDGAQMSTTDPGSTQSPAAGLLVAPVLVGVASRRGRLFSWLRTRRRRGAPARPRRRTRASPRDLS